MVDTGASARVAVVFRSPAGEHAWAAGAEEGPVLNPRLAPMAEALTRCGLSVVPVQYAEHREAETAAALTDVTAVLVWADPLSNDGDRHALDRVLRDVAETGTWVSAHPDTVDRLGTKAVLVATRHLAWGSDVHLYGSAEEFRSEFPQRLAEAGVRVLKATRGNGGRTVWKVRLPGGSSPTAPLVTEQVLVQHARARDGSTQAMSLAELMETCGATFATWGGAGAVVDQEFVAGITAGIVRCYLVGPNVVGFGRQYPEGTVPDGPLRVAERAEGAGPSAESVMGLPSPKTMYPPDEPAFARLRERLERQWVPQLLTSVGLGVDDLPVLWDIDLMVDGAETADGREPRFVLCEVNASSVIPFPPEAPDRVAAYVTAQLARRRA